MVSLIEYIRYAIKKEWIFEWLWVTSLIGVHKNGYSSKYFKIEDNKMYVMMDDWVLFKNESNTPNAVSISDSITIGKEDLACLDKDIKTTIGKFLINYILIEYPFKGVLKYLDGEIDSGRVIELVKESLSKGVITTADYKVFVIACSYLENMNKLVTPSSTKKLILPPTGLKEFKKKLKQEFVSKYGEDWEQTPSNVVEYSSKLKAFYEDYIKDDASDGVLANGKHKGNALAKKYLTFGSTNAFGEQVHVDESLLDGYPKDPDKLAPMFNTIRSASYYRGNETQKGGSVAKSILRATSSISIVPGDCGVKQGKVVLVTEDNFKKLVGRYVMHGTKSEVITGEFIKKNIGNRITIRTPGNCLEPAPNFCSVCMGENAAAIPSAVPLIVTNVSSVITTSALKAMHNTQISTIKVELADMLR